MEWVHVWVPEDLNGKASPNGKRPIGWHEKEHGCKYLLKHPAEELRDREVTLVFNYDIMPVTGSIRTFPRVATKTFSLPQAYTRHKKSL